MDIRSIPIVSLYVFVMSQGVVFLNMLTLSWIQASKNT